MPYNVTSRTSATCYPVPLWDPESVLELYGDGCCVGFAPSQRRKCRKPIAYHNAEIFDRLVDQISMQQPDADLLHLKLVRMAKYGLCRAYHQNQIESIVEKWSALIRAEDNRQQRGRRDTSSTTVSRPITSTSTRSSSPLPARSSSTRRSSRSTLVEISSPTADNVLASFMASRANIDTEELVASMLAWASENARQPSVRSPTRVSTSDISSLHLSRSATLSEPVPIDLTIVSVSAANSSPLADSPLGSTLEDSQPEPEATTSPVRVTLLDTTLRDSQSGTEAITSLGAATPLGTMLVEPQTEPEAPIARGMTTRSSGRSQTFTTHNGSHARRLPTNEECTICYDGCILSECDPTEVVWCHSGCGRSFHKSCFETWRNQRLSDGLAPTCSNCRVEWDESCECDGCVIRHVQRRTIEADCAICKESMMEDEDHLTWCIHGCGRSVHGDCFDLWKTACESAYRDTTCVICRAIWKGDCAH